MDNQLTESLQDHQKGVAIKIFKMMPDEAKYILPTYKSVRREIDKVLYFNPHPHIVQVLGVLSHPYGIVLELAPIGDLQSAIIDQYQYRKNLLCSTALLLTLKQVSSYSSHDH